MKALWEPASAGFSGMSRGIHPLAEGFFCMNWHREKFRTAVSQNSRKFIASR
jgi:hypothetical protein